MTGTSASAARSSEHSRVIRDEAQQGQDDFIISSRTIEGRCIVLSRYLDSHWRLVGQPTNKPPSEQSIDFEGLSPAWRDTMKVVLYRYLSRGREGHKRPSPRGVIKLFRDVRPFLRHLDELGINRLAAVTPLACSSYVDVCKGDRTSGRLALRSLKSSALVHRFAAVEALYELSQQTADAMPIHPWVGASARYLAGLTGRGTGCRVAQTPLMPDEVFTALFRRAWSLVEGADALLELRDELLEIRQAVAQDLRGIATHAERQAVRRRGWTGTNGYRKALLELRTACYIVVASLSGCRNHELAFIENDACYSTDASKIPGDEPHVFWWLRSTSTKTGEGQTQWMVPDAAVTAVRVMERWARPYQALIKAEIKQRRSVNPLDPEIAEAERHSRAIFLSATPMKGNQVRTMSGQMCNLALKAFSKKC